MATVIGVPQTDADNNGVGTQAWSAQNEYAKTDDTNYDIAPYSTIDAGVQTHYLFLTSYTNLNTIPAGATINSITLDLKRVRAGLGIGTVKDAVIRYLVGGVVTGANKAETSTDWGSETTVQYVWNTGMPTRDQVAATDFGIAISATIVKTGGGTNVIAEVNYAPVTINYTPAATFKPMTVLF